MALPRECHHWWYTPAPQADTDSGKSPESRMVNGARGPLDTTGLDRRRLSTRMVRAATDPADSVGISFGRSFPHPVR